MKSNSLYKLAHNRGLAGLEACEVGADIGSEPQWAAALGVSRTTVRADVQPFRGDRPDRRDGRRKSLQRRPPPRDLYPESRPSRSRRASKSDS